MHDWPVNMQVEKRGGGLSKEELIHLEVKTSTRPDVKPSREEEE
jgi:hypothetical protein